jgi:hypothetical protein
MYVQVWGNIVVRPINVMISRDEEQSYGNSVSQIAAVSYQLSSCKTAEIKSIQYLTSTHTYSTCKHAVHRIASLTRSELLSPLLIALPRRAVCKHHALLVLEVILLHKEVEPVSDLLVLCRGVGVVHQEHS